MKIYFEEIFVLNFLLDFMILYGTKRILKIHKALGRVFLGSLIGSLSTFLLFLNMSFLSLFFLKISLGILLILISFGFSNVGKNTFYFYMISICLGGFFYLFDLSNSIFYIHCFLIGGTFFLMIFFIYEFLSYREKYINKYLVTIFYQKKKYCLEGFIDTGNRLVSPIGGESVILVNVKIPCRKIIYVPYKALNTSGVVPCIRPDRVIIDHHEFKNCLIGLADEKFSLSGVNCILPNCFKEDLC